MTLDHGRVVTMDRWGRETQGARAIGARLTGFLHATPCTALTSSPAGSHFRSGGGRAAARLHLYGTSPQGACWESIRLAR